MQNKILERLQKDPRSEDLFQLLSEDLSSSDLQSLLIEVFRIRSQKISPAHVIHELQDNRFYKPSDIPQIVFNRIDQLVFSLLLGDWHSLDLSPVVPLGTCTSVSNLSQNRMLSTIRNSELVADSTNTLALKASLLRKEYLKREPKSPEIIKCCSSHRLLRAQSFEDEKFSAHFRVFSMVSAGRDTGQWEFEINQLEEHISYYLALSAKLAILQDAEVHVSDFTGNFKISAIDEMFERLAATYNDVEMRLDPDRIEARNYYSPLAFRIRFRDEAGRSWDLVDGGFTNWTQLLLNNRKERMLSSAIGTELLLKVFPAAKSYLEHPDI